MPDPAAFSSPLPHDDLVIVDQVIARADTGAYRADIDRSFHESLDLAPSLAQRVRAGERVERYRFTTDLDGFLRRPSGPGWALVGDAGYHKDPVTAQGIRDAFRDAELLADPSTSASTATSTSPSPTTATAATPLRCRL